MISRVKKTLFFLNCVFSRFSGFFPKGDEAWLIGPSMFPLKLAGFWSLQALWPMVVLLPVFVSQKLNPSFRMTSRRLIPFCGFLLGFLWETIADVQKFIRKSKPGMKDHWIQTGNKNRILFFEILF